MGQNFRLLLLGVGGAIAFSFTSLVVHAGGWDNFKLQYGFVGQVMHSQGLEFEALYAQAVDPVANTRIELAELRNGGPPKDGIPSLDAPNFDTTSTTPFNSEEPVIGLVLNGEAVAYPLGILNWHEIVNDTVGGVNVSLTYCPLCDTAIAFDRGDSTFGVSGKLYQSCLIMYDRDDDSLFSQPWGIGVVRRQMNQSLQRYPIVKTRLGQWMAQYPETKILAADTGYNRDYFRYPYGSYLTSDRVLFSVRNQHRIEHHPKTPITYVWEANSETPFDAFGGASHPFVNAMVQAQGEVQVEFNGRPIRAQWDPVLETVIVTEMDGTPLVSSPAFAFVYPAFFDE